MTERPTVGPTRGTRGRGGSTPRRVRGVTLLELTISLGVGATIAAAAMVLTSDFGRFHHRQVGHLSLGHRLRSAAELLAADIRNAGVGVGYTPSGRFGGLVGGPFTAPGGATFEPAGRDVETPDGTVRTDDLVLRRAIGARRTILGLDPGSVEICRGLSLAAGDRVVASARTGLSARTLRVQGAVEAACTLGRCMDGCTTVSFSDDPSYVSDPSALTRTFRGGDLFTDFQVVAWFVATDDDGEAALRRAELEALETCATAGSSCGGEVAGGIETLQIRWARFDEGLSSWVELDPSQPVETFDRLRVDLELLGRARGDPKVGKTQPVVSQLEPGLCLPMPCGAERDSVPRLALRTTVEVRNAGRLRIR